MVLERHIGNFDAYALHSRHTFAFDIMLCAICCGATDLAKTMWYKRESPLRSALIATDFCSRLTSLEFEDDSISELTTFFREAATGVLKEIPVDLRDQVLLAVPKEDEKLCWHGVDLLGMHGRSWYKRLWTKGICTLQSQRPEYRLKWARKPRKSILDVAIALRNEDFVSLSACQKVLRAFWRGKSARCGKVMLGSDHGNDPVAITFNRDAIILVQVLLLLLFLPIMLVIDALSWLLSTAQTLGGGRTDEDGNAGTCAQSSSDPTSVLPRLLPTTINEYYPWSQWSCPDDEAEIHITPIVESIQIFHIPYVKRVMYITCNIGYTILLVIVSFQPLCEPLNGTHYTFGYWTLARLWYQCHHYVLRNSARERWYRPGGTTLVDLVATGLLVTAGELRVSLDPEIFSSTHVRAESISSRTGGDDS